MGADEALAEGQGDKPGPDADERDAAEYWLAALLANGPLEVGKIKEEAAAAGMAWRTVHRAKDALGVCPYRQQFGGAWLWKLAITGDRQSTPRDPFQ